jgi:shikimate dehydrogenase
MPHINKKSHPNSSETKRVFLLGTDISRSISPLVQNVAFAELGINARYELKELNRNGLKEFLSSVSKSRTLLGFNVTFPFKEEIIKFLSALDSRAKSIGAVNTVSVHNKTHEMRGFNTDYDGVVATLEKLDAIRGHKGERVVVFGAGGASRACILALLEVGYTRITILNRTVIRAEIISKEFKLNFPDAELNALPLTKELVSSSLENCYLAVNTISNSSKYFPVELDISRASKDTKFFDLGYRGKSFFLESARSKGFRVQDGLLMLVVQAAKSFEIWTGRKAPIKLMMETAKSTLERRS